MNFRNAQDMEIVIPTDTICNMIINNASFTDVYNAFPGLFNDHSEPLNVFIQRHKYEIANGIISNQHLYYSIVLFAMKNGKNQFITSIETALEPLYTKLVDVPVNSSFTSYRSILVSVANITMNIQPNADGIVEMERHHFWNLIVRHGMCARLGKTFFETILQHYHGRLSQRSQDDLVSLVAKNKHTHGKLELNDDYPETMYLFQDDMMCSE